MTPERLRHWQRRHRLTNRSAASILGIPQRTWESWIGGKRQPSALAGEMLEIKLRAYKPSTADMAKQP